MALKKKYEYGTKKGEYWKIIGIHTNSMYSNTKVRVALYKDEATRRKSEASYVLVLPLTIKGTDHSQKTAYEQVRNKAEFDGCEDC